MPKNYLVEADVKDSVKTLLKKYDVWYFMPSASAFGRQGIPDFICCCRGWFLAIETKFGNRLTTAHQQREISAIVAAGGHAHVINQHKLDLLEAIIKVLIKEPKA
jgi:hypothetical protein